MTKDCFISDCKDRLDKLVSSRLSSSRNQAEHLIKEGFVSIRGKKVFKCGHMVNLGDEIEILITKEESKEPKSIDFDVKVIYEDEEILVINKHPGLIIHKAPSVKEPTLVDWLLSKGYALSKLNGSLRPGIVHRLDKETSGVMVVAKSDLSHISLSKQLKNREMGRVYLAIIDMPLKEHTVVDKPIARNPTNRLKMGVFSGGREAKSRFAKIATSKNGALELIAAKLHSGRTHQIRVHLAHINRHIVGDVLYGFKAKSDNFPRVMLHSAYLSLKHPKSGEGMIFAGELFEDFEGVLSKNFDLKEIYERLTYSYINSVFAAF